MKKLMMALLMLGMMPTMMLAQDDDMYFVPTKEKVAEEAKSYGMPSNTYYSGSNRSIDEYNRRGWSAVTPVDSMGNDVIDFSAVRGVYPDSVEQYQEIAADNYRYTKRMSRFDDYSPSAAYWDGYRDGQWSSPWYSSYYSWYDPWYWNDPWYYGYYGYYGYYRPWYYSGYYRPYYWGGYYTPRYYHTHHHRPGGGSYGRTRTVPNRNVGGNRVYHNGTSTRYPGGTFGGSSVSRSGSSTRSSSSSAGSRGFGGSTPTRSSGGGFGGGSRSGGGNFGGARSGGSGGFGTRR